MCSRTMTKTERVKAAVNFQEVDRIPLGLWPHHTDVDQDYVKLADKQFAFYRETDIDFVKLMPFGLYTVEDYGCKIEKICQPDQWPRIAEAFIETPEDWEKIVPLDVTKGTYGNQLKYAERMLQLMKEHQDEAPVIHTIFSPITTLYKLLGEKKLFEEIEAHPTLVHRALEQVTETTIAFVNENIKLGVSGFFFASQLANYRFMTNEMYDVFGEQYDLKVIGAYADRTWFNVIHVHSFTQEKEKSMFERLANYPGTCLNWHDRWVGPSLAEARKYTDKCLIGGINEEQYFNKTSYQNVYGHIREAVEMAGRTGFMLGPGCTIYEDTPLENYLAARIAATKYGK